MEKIADESLVKVVLNAAPNTPHLKIYIKRYYKSIFKIKARVFPIIGILFSPIALKA